MSDEIDTAIEKIHIGKCSEIDKDCKSSETYECNESSQPKKCIDVTKSKKIVNEYKPTNDYIFGRLFGDKDSKDILKSLIQSILPDLKIKDISVSKQFFLDKAGINKKFGRMDVVATLDNNTIVDIEMQTSDAKNTIDRATYYTSGLLYQSLQSHCDYTSIKRAISIWILTFDLFKEDGPYHEVVRMKRDFNNEVTTNKVEEHFIQLPKFKKTCQRAKTLEEQWLKFIINDDVEEIKAMDNEEINKAEEKLEFLNFDDQEKAYAAYVLDAMRNENDVRKWERAEGIKQGIEQGIEQGKAEGIEQQKIETVKKMLNEKIDIALISKIIGLSEERIKEIQSETDENME